MSDIPSVIYITTEFSEELDNLGCGQNDYITVTRVEGNRVYFSAGSCKFNIQASEVENVTRR